ALIDMGDFVGGMLKYLRRHPVRRLTVAGGFGKMIKLAQGAKDLHSGRSQIDFADLAARAKALGLPAEHIADANSALEVMQNLNPEHRQILATAIAAGALATCRQVIGKTSTCLGTMVVDREGQILSEQIE
ncbi:MAG: cobalt-precorrin-5B (C(1))-methyltransferase, partial [Alphaproteobacteria bacterium]|nr:cobalt-precorrin-5B (C(1))-methyltransferase [Alphaproteobacteria bacterium]